LRPLKSTKGSANARQQPPRAANRSAIAVKHDIGQEYEWRAAIDSTIQEFGRLDILVNNPRIGPSKPLLLETAAQQQVPTASAKIALSKLLTSPGEMRWQKHAAFGPREIRGKTRLT
jgi:NAD(P)-dependent dehydrogenase (short-subunit alcohol dehydrogenase family)